MPLYSGNIAQGASFLSCSLHALYILIKHWIDSPLSAKRKHTWEVDAVMSCCYLFPLCRRFSIPKYTQFYWKDQFGYLPTACCPCSYTSAFIQTRLCYRWHCTVVYSWGQSSSVFANFREDKNEISTIKGIRKKIRNIICDVRYKRK